METFQACNDAADRGKDIDLACGWMPLFWSFQRAEKDTRTCLHPYFTEITVKAGVIPGIDLGFNPGEFVDFLLGWTTVDIFKDDLGQRQTGEEGEKPVEAKSRKYVPPAVPQP